jgi:hypothetical protein
MCFTYRDSFCRLNDTKCTYYVSFGVYSTGSGGADVAVEFREKNPSFSASDQLIYVFSFVRVIYRYVLVYYRDSLAYVPRNQANHFSQR